MTSPVIRRHWNAFAGKRVPLRRYFSGFESLTSSKLSTWRISMDTFSAEKFMDGCGFAIDSSADGKFLLMTAISGDNTGIYTAPVADKTCVSLVPNVVVFF